MSVARTRSRLALWSLTIGLTIALALPGALGCSDEPTSKSSAATAGMTTGAGGNVAGLGGAGGVHVPGSGGANSSGAGMPEMGAPGTSGTGSSGAGGAMDGDPDKPTGPFVHPGLLSTMADLNVAKDNQAIEPWKSALAALKASPSASLTYEMQGPYPSISRGAGTVTGWSQHGNDATACYTQAVLWYITDNATYATNAKNIINAWSSTLVSIGGADVELLAGLQGPLWALAGEILAYTNAGWADADITRAKTMLTDLFLPAMAGFDPDDGANFSTACIFSTMAIAVFTDNRAKFDEAWGAFISTSGCPNDYSLLRNIAPNGQNVESGRDQIHTWLSHMSLASAAEVAFHQGKDPYSLGSNRLQTGAEYWSKYNLGNDVPFDPSVYRCRPGWGPWSSISSAGRGVPTSLGSTSNMMYRAYKRIGLESPYTKQMAAAMGNRVAPPSPANGWANPYVADALLFVMPP